MCMKYDIYSKIYNEYINFQIMNLDSSLSYGDDVGDARFETIVIIMFLFKKIF